MMIYRKTKGLTFVEIIVSVAILSIIILGGAQAIKYVMHAMVKDRQEIQANNFSQMILEELKARCVPETFLKLENSNTDDWEGNLPKRKFPNLRGKVSIGSLQTNGQRKTVITIEFLNWLDNNNIPKRSEYHITLVKNTGLEPKGVISGRVVNYVTGRGIPNAEVSAPGAKIDGIPGSTLTRTDGSFTLTNVKVGLDIPVTVTKLGSHPNDMNYSPGYYFDPDLIDTNTMEPYNPIRYENPNSVNDKLSWEKTFNVDNGVVTHVGTVYLCPMGIVRGWVREDENDPNTGIGRILVYFGNSLNFNTPVLNETYRSSMHPYYTYGEVHGTGSTTELLRWANDSPLSYSGSTPRYGNYYVTTRDTMETYTYSVEDVNIPFTLYRGEYVFFNIRPGSNINTYPRHLKMCGRPGSNPMVQQNDPNFSWGYLRGYFYSTGNRYPNIEVKANHCFDTTGSSSFIGPYINEELGSHETLPVNTPEYKYYYYGNCTHTNHNFNVFALASTFNTISMSCSQGEDFSQKGWNNVESLLHYDADKYPTCFVARRRGGIQGRIIDAYNGFPIQGITVRAKVWADVSISVSWQWTRQFNNSCPSVATDANGEFHFYNLYGMEQQYYATGKPYSPLLNWDGHMDALRQACLNDTSMQDYALLRITDNRNPRDYMPRLIRPHYNGVFDHQAVEYPFPTWAVNLGTSQEGITDFGDIALVNKALGVTVTGQLINVNGPVQGANIMTRGIYGLSIDSNGNVILGMTNQGIVQATTNSTGNFILTDVMPNFVLLNNNNPVNNIVYDNTQPRGSIQRFQITGPTIPTLTDVTVQGRVTDIYTGAPVDGADVYEMVDNAQNNNYTIQSNLITTNSNGDYFFFGDIDGISGSPFWHFEHLPADTSDPYKVNLSNYVPITWESNFIANRTINIGVIDIGLQGNQRQIAVGAKKPGSMLGAYRLGNTYETSGTAGEYLVGNNSFIANADITLLRIYRVKFFGRVIDGEGKPLQNSRIYLRIYSPYTGWYNSWVQYTNSGGYWGDWTPVDSPGNRGGGEINKPLPGRHRNWGNPGAPYWNIKVRAYRPSGITLQSGVSYIERSITTQPHGWINGNQVTWQDGYAVQVGTITLNISYADGM